MRHKERICILIDGANFYYLVLKKMGLKDLEFSFENFAMFLAGEREICEKGKRFYIGTIREKVGDLKSKRAMSKQTTLFTRLMSSGWEVKTSKLRTRTEKIIIDQRVADYQDLLNKGVKMVVFQRTREKGIDVKIATDLIVGAIDNQYDTAVVVSADTDLIPALDWVRRRKKKKIEYVGFSIEAKNKSEKNTRPSQGMITHSDIQRILVNSDLQPFIKFQKGLLGDKN